MGITPDAIKIRLEQNWLEFLKVNSSKLQSEKLDGSSPPSVFVGEFGYPKVRVGPLVPPFHGDTVILDKPELWAGKNLEEVIGYRLGLVLGTVVKNVHQTDGNYIESLQDLAMSQRPADSEVTFERKISIANSLNGTLYDGASTPFGPSAPVKQLSLLSASADRRIESAYYDTDLHASDAIFDMYSAGLDVSNINRVLSMGMIGVKKARRLVPTKWSITATDDVISRRLVSNLESYPTIDICELTSYRHMDNLYSVILLPMQNWSFELIEYWITRTGEIAVGSDYEGPLGLNHYPETAGAFYAAKLAVTEYFEKIGRKGAAIVLREIQPGYVMPMGVWQVRQGVREALKSEPRRFESINSALQHASVRHSASATELVQRSRIYGETKSQAKITDFLPQE